MPSNLGPRSTGPLPDTIRGHKLTKDEQSVLALLQLQSKPLTFNELVELSIVKDRHTMSNILTDLSRKDLIMTVYVEGSALCYKIRAASFET